MHQTRQIALLSSLRGNSQRVAQGALDYARRSAGRVNVRSWRLDTDGLDVLDGRKGRVDGLIVSATSVSIYARVRDLGVPAVNVSVSRPAMRLPRVHVDNRAVGAAAAEHLLASGARRLACIGTRQHLYSHLRMSGFRDTLTEAGIDCAVAWDAGEDRCRAGADLLTCEDWLQSLDPPVAVLAATDTLALCLLEAALAAGFDVPEQVSIVGVDNEAMQCELAPVPLSSVELAPQRIGRLAMRQLQRGLDEGAALSQRQTLLEPVGVVARQSSDPFAADDPTVTAALRYIRAHAHEPIQVTDVAREIGANRRSMERAFKRSVGITPYQMIIREHIELSKRLLAAGEIPICRIAEQCGFSYQHHFSTVFRRVIGQTPSRYRARFVD
jgi:LacI family transcriptional regulator